MRHYPKKSTIFGTQEMFYISSCIKEHKLFCSIICVLRYTIGKDINFRKWISLPILADFNNYHPNIKVRGYNCLNSKLHQFIHRVRSEGLLPTGTFEARRCQKIPVIFSARKPSRFTQKSLGPKPRSLERLLSLKMRT